MRFCTRYCFFLLVLFNYGCKKNSDHSPGSGTITGSWELREASGAWSGGVNYPAGNGNIIAFTGTDYKMYKSGSVVKSGQFTVVPDATVSTSVCLVFPANQFTNRIIYDSDLAATKVFYQVAGDSLTLISGCYAYDAGHSEVYARISNFDFGD